MGRRLWRCVALGLGRWAGSVLVGFAAVCRGRPPAGSVLGFRPAAALFAVVVAVVVLFPLLSSSPPSSSLVACLPASPACLPACLPPAVAALPLLPLRCLLPCLLSLFSLSCFPCLLFCFSFSSSSCPPSARVPFPWAGRLRPCACREPKVVQRQQLKAAREC